MGKGSEPIKQENKNLLDTNPVANHASGPLKSGSYEGSEVAPKDKPEQKTELEAIKFKDFAETANKKRTQKETQGIDVSKSISKKDKKKVDRKTKRKARKSARLDKKIALQEFKGKQKLKSGDKTGAHSKAKRVARLKARKNK